jgi:RIO kinase 2
MVDEDQNVWTIDFPQMVSTSHSDADFYFERDQTCIHTLFKRKFNFTFDRRYKLSDIPVTVSLDKEVKASGAGKMTAEDVALGEYLKAAADRKEGDDYDGEEGDDYDGADGEGGDDGEEGGDGEDNDEGNDGDVEGHEVVGDIEEEMKAMNMGAELEADKAETKDDGQPGQATEEGEEEEVDWEARQEKRKQMKALKKEKLAAKKPRIVAVPTPAPAEKQADSTDAAKEGEEESESDEDSEKETELIKKALKKKYRKKKVFKTNKNHPKQFNEAVREQMQF